MHDYNLALLAKQGWRIVQRPDSLLARVLKARYFPTSSFMHARVAAGDSFVWRSIMAGMVVLERGMRYQVGNGASISVWNDNWFSLPYSFRPYSLPMLGWEALMVADLIDPDDKTWQLHMLQELFTPHEMSIIASIPLSLRQPMDRWVWHFDRQGRYSVKSGYFVLRESRKLGTKASTSSTIHGGELGKYWSRIWSAKVPAKVKHFMWKLLRGFLPTKAALHARKVSLPDLSCVLCGDEVETSIHLFKNCMALRESFRAGRWLKDDYFLIKIEY